MKVHLAGISILILPVLVACGGSNGGSDSAAACAALAGRKIAAATVVAAVDVAASGPAPAYCKVSARIEPALNFEMRIPNAWNGKLHYGGGGGFNGFIPAVFDAAGGGGTDLDNHGLNLAALNRGYINLSSDSGHAGKIPGLEAVDASWVPGNPTAEALYAQGAVPTVMAAAAEMIKETFGRAPTASYFEGCSNGGREALINAQRYPELFDGVIARAPASNFVASVGAFQRNMRAAALNPTLNFTPAKVALLSNAVLAACDALDGIADGVVSNPAACSFDANTARTTLRCAGGTDTGDSCLSDDQLALVDTWTTAKTFAGTYVTPGWPLTGNESAPGNWDPWLFSGIQFLFQYGAISGFILKDPATGPLPPQDATAVNTLFFDFDDPANATALASFSGAVDATNPDLRAFTNSGRKLLLWHGGTDPALSVKNTTGYYQNVVAAVGGQATADTFARYYIAPGVNHCHGGVGADKSDLLAALDDWVTKGTAPAALNAAQLAADGSINFTRPLCRYPQYPRYTGPAGDANAAKLAANYTCTTP
ncbi:MAG TPA: tannase/feruloyl esterase family alpha/beta hydrolase [Burkholderiaceae bacterium]|nr:tannase/feruloyl esterase family alpha/beta hydrolase [Burkholderiaceae bacterium]